MSLLEFPPLDSSGRSYCVQELNGRLVYGPEEEVELASKSDLLSNLPVIEKSQLHCLQHALSRENVRRVFSDVQSSGLAQAYEIWQRDGAKGVLEYVTNLSEGTRYGWPIASVGHAYKRAEDGFNKLFVTSEESAQEAIAKTTDVLNCPDGERLAVCQKNDYVRIYLCNGSHKTPLTLKHPSQKDVSHMAWKPYDQFALAVACSSVIVIWRFRQQTLSYRVPMQCAQIVEIPSMFNPATQCIWDSSLSSTLFVVSPSSSQILILDATNGDHQSIGGWLDGRIRRLWLSPDGLKFLVAYHSNTIKIYDRETWKEERWSKLKGKCTGAAWSPDGSHLLFSCENEPLIRAIRFVSRIEITADGQRLQRRYGSVDTLPVFEISELQQELGEDGDSRLIGGAVRDMKLSPDGRRLAVTFRKDCSIVAMFLVDYNPTIRLTPCGLIEGLTFGDATLIKFVPKFSNGSLFSVVWSAGQMQYIPLIYGSAAETSRAINLLSSFSVPKHSAVSNSPSARSASPAGPSSSSSSGSEKENAEAEAEEPQLFSTAGLFDQLVSKSQASS